MTTNTSNVAAIRAEIVAQLGYDTDNPPVHINDKRAAEILGVTAGTLSVWRSTGRYDLPFSKVGRLVRYRVNDLAAFLDRRTANRTGGLQT